MPLIEQRKRPNRSPTPPTVCAYIVVTVVVVGVQVTRRSTDRRVNAMLLRSLRLKNASARDTMGEAAEAEYHSLAAAGVG